MDIQRAMFQRVSNGLNDLHHELLGDGVDVQFEVKETSGGLTVKFTVSGGKVARGAPYIVGEPGPETIVYPQPNTPLVMDEIDPSAGFDDELTVPTLPKKTKGG